MTSYHLETIAGLACITIGVGWFAAALAYLTWPRRNRNAR